MVLLLLQKYGQYQTVHLQETTKSVSFNAANEVMKINAVRVTLRKQDHAIYRDF